MKYTYFISDLHLGARYLDNPKESERRVVEFLDSIKDTAERIYMLGDILDFWYEYKYVVPRGYVRFFGKLAELADAGIEIYWMLGNHDIWIFDYLPNEIGIKVIDGPVVHQIGSEKFYLSHGDNEGKMPKTYKIMRGIFRNKACQWLYGHINPNFTMPFALGWSNNNRTKRSPITVKTEMSNSLDNIRESLNAVSLSNPDIEYFILGHFHAIHDTKLATGKRMLVIGDWISHFSYACYNSVEKSLSINKF